MCSDRVYRFRQACFRNTRRSERSASTHVTDNNIVAGTKTRSTSRITLALNLDRPCAPDSFSTMRQDITGLALINAGSRARAS